MHESIRHILARDEAGGEVSLQGWVRTARHGKEVSFLEINDGSCLSGLQVVAGPRGTPWGHEVCEGCANLVRPRYALAGLGRSTRPPLGT